MCLFSYAVIEILICKQSSSCVTARVVAVILGPNTGAVNVFTPRAVVMTRKQLETWTLYHCVNKPFDLSRLVCHSAGVCCGWRESDEKAARGERGGASHGQKGSVHLRRVSVDQRIGNTQHGNTRSNTQCTTV